MMGVFKTTRATRGVLEAEGKATLATGERSEHEVFP